MFIAYKITQVDIYVDRSIPFGFMKLIPCYNFHLPSSTLSTAMLPISDRAPERVRCTCRGVTCEKPQKFPTGLLLHSIDSNKKRVKPYFRCQHLQVKVQLNRQSLLSVLKTFRD